MTVFVLMKIFVFSIISLIPMCIFGGENGETKPISQIHEKGTIIILNGPSASGKSSIQNALQKKFPELYLKVGIDTFFDGLIATPDLSQFEQTKEFSQYTNDGILIRRVRLIKDENGFPVVPLDIGPAGDKIIFGMHSAIAAYAERGNNLIVDYILYKPEWLSDMVETFKNQNVYYIGIKAPLSVLEEREKKRGTSPVGHARSHYDTVHKGVTYDLELDVSTMTPEQSADKIYEFVRSRTAP